MTTPLSLSRANPPASPNAAPGSRERAESAAAKSHQPPAEVAAQPFLKPIGLALTAIIAGLPVPDGIDRQ